MELQPPTWKDMVGDVLEIIRSMADDAGRTVEWATGEAGRDDCHPEDRDRFETEAGQWSMVEIELNKAAGFLEQKFGANDNATRAELRANLTAAEELFHG